MIQVDRVIKNFGPIRAVRDVSFEVAKGEIVGFLGPNGAGKTTTLRMLVGLLPPTSGTIKVAGLDVKTDPIGVRRRVGYVPENVPLYKEMRVRDYLQFVAALKDVPRARRAGEIDSIAEQTGLNEVIGRPINQLSKGYRQRVGLAQALLGDPEVLVLDEPTIGLDPRQIVDIRRLIQSYAGQKTIILSSHILPEVAATCQRVVIINRGRVIAEDTPAGLEARLGRAGGLVLTVIGDATHAVEVIGRVEGVTGVRAGTVVDGRAEIVVDVGDTPSVRPALARSLVEAGLDLSELRERQMSLEEIFVSLVGTPDQNGGADSQDRPGGTS